MASGDTDGVINPLLVRRRDWESSTFQQVLDCFELDCMILGFEHFVHSLLIALVDGRIEFADDEESRGFCSLDCSTYEVRLSLSS